MSSNKHRISLFIILLLLTLSFRAQQPKNVYITLDVSGSMYGNKYALANYTTQMIVTLCDDDDEVHMIVFGEEENLSKKKSPLDFIQKPVHDLRFGKPKSIDSQFDDIIGFNKIYKPSNKRQDWLFIIGDGEWWTENKEYESDRKCFASTVESGKLNVCYLQTGHKLKENNDFTQFVSSLGVVDIKKSDVTTKTIKDGCDHFARKILGFSEVPLKVKKTDSQSISLRTELPINRFYLVYQDDVKPSKLPKITNVEVNGIALKRDLKGTPTTTPLNVGGVNLSGHVYKISGKGVIAANSEINISFDKNIDPKNIFIYPFVENIEFGSSVFTRTGNQLGNIDANTSTICKDENKATVRIDLSKESVQSLSVALLKRTNVIVKANNKEYPAKYKNGGFECEIDLIEDETQYYAECDCPGYFKRVTPIAKIVKRECEPDVMETREQPVTNMGSITFEQLKKEELSFTITDSLTQEALNPNLFDISCEIEDDFMYEDPQIRVEDGEVHILLSPKGDWCECLFPAGLDVKLISTPKQEAFQEYGKNYYQTIYPFHLEVIKERPWLLRCFCVIVSLISLIILICYLRALLKKNRFHKGARVKNLYYQEDAPKEIEKNGHPLRANGFMAWFNRWLNPFGDEKNTISFVRPKTRAITFYASASKMRILLPINCYDPKTMVVPNYIPQREHNKKKDDNSIGISSGTSIEIKNTQAGETTRLGHIKFIVQGKDDEGGYRLFLSIVLVVAVLAFVALSFLLVKSFI